MTEKTVLRAARVDVTPVAPPAAQGPKPRRGRKQPRVGRSGRLFSRVGSAWRKGVGRSREGWASTRDRLGPTAKRLGDWLSVVSRLGWGLGVGTVLAWTLAARLGWLEFGYVAAVFGLVLALSALFTIGRLRLAVDLVVDPLRVRVGDSSAAQLRITNTGATPLLPIGIEMPVGAAVARYTSPILKPGSTYEELALIPTERRGVVVLGPITTQRGDPFGVFRREVSWTNEVEISSIPGRFLLSHWAPACSVILRARPRTRSP